MTYCPSEAVGTAHRSMDQKEDTGAETEAEAAPDGVAEIVAPPLVSPQEPRISQRVKKLPKWYTSTLYHKQQTEAKTEPIDKSSTLQLLSKVVNAVDTLI